ncbi:MAG: CpaF family protein [Candidatus Diapherotrites archaeon]|uniref:CpaF family protein n=1 Tax=Candidatus Iainarchaeum sp. TaxID=3101447 RepID=A0A8T4C5T1_9ARCH|nr:CpaF family protein [Candidatus Diapherotrites archaeon]
MSFQRTETYTVQTDILVSVDIGKADTEFVKSYILHTPEFGPGTRALLNDLKSRIITEVNISSEKMLDAKFVNELKKTFHEKAEALLGRELPELSADARHQLAAVILNEMVGLGPIEFLLADGNLEEIVVNSATEPVWVYHKKHGWLKTNIIINPEAEIQNYASIIARRVGKQVTILNPLLDAYLVTGDRANASLFPISSRGNTITIRRFRRDPWTVTDFIDSKTASAASMAMLWLAMEYELNIIVSGGTGSGKTTLLNVMLPYIQPNQRVLTIEDTRELQLPDFLHWVPMTTREPNAEGKGAVTMLDLLVNSLRMRPDRIIVGEIRRQREAEVMFEAMHTGHSVYATVHANTAEETITRLISPPIEIPSSLLEAVHLNVVMFRNRRLGVRRILQLAEFVPQKAGSEGKIQLKPNILYRWRAATDTIEKYAESIRLFDELALHTGYTAQELTQNLSEKQRILEWMDKQKVRDINEVGKVMAQYYAEPEAILKKAGIK